MKTYALALSGTPLPIVAQTVCEEIDVYELRSVVGWPTTALIRTAPTSSDAQEYFEPGQVIVFRKPMFGVNLRARSFLIGEVVGYVFLPTGTTSGIQVES